MIVKITLEKEDFPSLHDTVFEATGYDYNNDELLKIWNGLSRSTQLRAADWGMSDTQVREDIYMEIIETIDK